MTETPNRRGEDKAINEIKVSLATVINNTEHMAAYQDTCVKDREALYKRIRVVDVQIGVLESKQKTTSWISGVLLVTCIGTVFGVLGRWIFAHMK